MAINLGTAVGYLQLDITGFARGIDAAAAEVDTLGRRVSGASGVLSKVSTGLVTTGKVLTATVTGPLVAVGAEV